MLAASSELAVGGRSDGAGWSLFLKISVESECTIYTGRGFHSSIVQGKKENLYGSL